MNHQADAPKPLAGLRVLELARILAGPGVGQLLAARRVHGFTGLKRGLDHVMG
ncbi:MAG: hypothetical protein IOC90_11260 [Methylocystis sp.]|nr:hypothetical protein [Methylocystis sp.]MCA3584566.1 hypothetical protein [Methylocystis sp.]MCA3588596.1 hypothetical protein [Methylocystis sp.]MCA3591335.1 hypothetical protein [Methylocystis sp.]